ncbi:MAG: hypothetical protein AB1668_03365 [Nanoarchaeota archaeon]
MAFKKMDFKKAMGWTIIIVMVLSVIGFIGGSFFGNSEETSQKKEYNGFVLYENYDYWRLQIGDRQYNFKYFPTDLENITMPMDVSSLLSSDKVYLGYLPNDTLSVDGELNELAVVFYVHELIPQRACLAEEGCPDIPIINCEENKGIVLRSGAASLTKDGECLVMRASNSEELLKLNERVIYSLLGVMK